MINLYKKKFKKKAYHDATNEYFLKFYKIRK